MIDRLLNLYFFMETGYLMRLLEKDLFGVRRYIPRHKPYREALSLLF